MAIQRKSVEHTVERTPLTPHSPDEPTADTCLRSSDSSVSAITPTGRLRENDILTGRFRIVRFIAAGGMGEVYEVEDRQLQGVRLALKTILPHIAARPDMQERFEREVLLARRVSHPNLCPIYDIFHCRHEDTDLIFLTMKLLPGETLSARIDRDGPVPLEEAARIVEQVASALSAAHGAGILHRDIKTANIMLDGSGPDVRACVTDFGLARAYQSESTILTADGIAGTPGYLAPELFQGEPPSTATDIYAFGVVVYKMLSGHAPPYRPGTRDSFMDQLPANWRRFIDCCLQPSPVGRCHNLSEAVATLLTGSQVPRRPADGMAKITRRHILAMGAGTVAAAAGGVWLNWSRIDFALHPLPAKRFVALMDWPAPADLKIAPLISTVVDAIGNELARAEAYDHNLFIMPKHVGKGVTSLSQVNDVRESLGANLVLTASAVPAVNGFQLLLRVLDVAASKTLREQSIRVPLDEQLQLPEKAVRVAAAMLGIKQYKPNDDRSAVGTSNREAYQAFQEAEDLVKKENDEGLDAAIEKYKQAINLDPRYAMANAKLAMAYFRSYILHREEGALLLARANCKTALDQNPNLVEAHLALGSVLEWTGDKPGAVREISKALSIDPSNPRAMLFEGQMLTRCNRWQDAQEAFLRLQKARPNYWLAHEELGIALGWEGKYAKAAEEFRAASVAAPKQLYPLANLSSMYLQMGKLDDGLQIANRAWSLAPNAIAAHCMAAAFRYKRSYAEALSYALQATKLSPDYSEKWIELGDCCSFVKNKKKIADDAFARTGKLEEQTLQTNPTDGPAWMKLSLAQAKAGDLEKSLKSIRKADENYADDLDSQLLKVRVLELLGRRDEALATAARSLSRGAGRIQFEVMPDTADLRNDVRFQGLETSAS